MQRYRLYVNGKHEEPLSGQWFDSYDPYTGKPWAQIPRPILKTSIAPFAQIIQPYQQSLATN